jgi:hypothetical protein
MWTIRRLALFLVLLGLASPVLGQSTGIPQFPQTLPANSVVGRLGAGQAGPAEAIPFVTLSAQLNSIGYGNIAANKFFGGPTTGSATTPGFRLLVGADLPNPAASTLGGVESIACSTHQWLNTISTSGVPACAQPAFSDISSVPVATSGQEGIVQGDGNTLNISAGVISCQTTTSSQIGCSKPDNTTISVAAGVLTAIGSSATSITVGTTTIGSQVNANDFLTTNTTLADPGYGPTQLAHLTSCVNCGIASAASANNILFTLKDEAGNALSSTNPAVVCFRNDSTTAAAISCLNITSGPTLSIHASSNMGVAGTTQAYRVWLALFNDSGTVRLGGIVAVNYSTPSILSLDDTGTASSTTCSACTNATAAQTWYSTVGVSAKPFRLIGYVDFPAFATNGNWQTATVVHMCGVGCIRPGQPTGNIQTVTVNASDAGTTSTSYTTNTAMEVSITPASASNLVRVTVQGTLYTPQSATSCSARVIRGTSGSVVVGAYAGDEFGEQGMPTTIIGLDAPSTSSSQTYAGQRVTGNASQTCMWPEADELSSGSHYGYLMAEEIQG